MTSLKTPMTAALLALAFGLAACGGDDGGDALSKADLQKKADAICKDYSKKAESLKEPENIADPEQAATFFRKAADLADDQQGELAELTPADDVKSEWDAFLTATKKGGELFGKLADAAEAKDAQQGQDLLSNLDSISNDVVAKAKPLGLTDCGSS